MSEREDDDRCLAAITQMRQANPWMGNRRDVLLLADNLEARIKETRALRDKISLVEHLNTVYAGGPWGENFAKPFWEYYEDALRDPEPVTP